MFKLDALLESRCKHYGTNISHCGCTGFSFRGTCKHVDYIVGKVNDKAIELDMISKGMPDQGILLEEACKTYGDETIDAMKKLGQAIELKGMIIPTR